MVPSMKTGKSGARKTSSHRSLGLGPMGVQVFTRGQGIASPHLRGARRSVFVDSKALFSHYGAVANKKDAAHELGLERPVWDTPST